MQPALLPDLSGELCGIWAYIQWEEAGCPNRSQADADAEYQKSIEARKALPKTLNLSPYLTAAPQMAVCMFSCGAHT